MAKIRKYPVDLTGMHFKNFDVIEYAGFFPDKYGHNRQQWKCKCVCGKELILSRSDLTKKQIKSCGCLTKKLIDEANVTHGLSKTRLYHIWANIKDRCLNSKSSSYKYYGERGITICDEWKNDFIEFRDWALDNGYKEDLSIERINVNGNYEPNNCCWIPLKNQCKNTRWNKYYTLNGETHSTVEWSILLGGTEALVGRRLKDGWDLERALTTPARKGNYRYKDETRKAFDERRKSLLAKTRTELA